MAAIDLPADIAHVLQARKLRRIRQRAAVAALAALLLGGSGTTSQADPPAPTAAAQTTSTTPTKTQTVTKTETVTTPPKTTTVTAPTQTNTVIKTETVTAPTTATASHPGGAAAVGVVAANSEQPETEEGGLPGWAWGLIGLAVGSVAIGGISAYRHKHNQQIPPVGQDPTAGNPPPAV